MNKEVELLVKRYPILSKMEQSIWEAIEAISLSIEHGGKVLTCGNGGSAADSLHIVGELMKSFAVKRDIPAVLQADIARLFPGYADYYIRNLEGAIPAVSLVAETSLTTAYANDKTPDLVFAQQVLGLGKKGDVLIAISTSGNSSNVLHGVRIARTMGIFVIGLTGEGGGQMSELCDVLLDVPSSITYQIQELHLPIYHTICLALEKRFFVN